ncbi:DUF1737 domain-containing protein [Pontibacter chinhatensis]|uniref:DUF1737 domain-containing protein n=1 Tax=Pontibacter chinhatensis TaxID=1436961 RepID=A0A1I2WVJ3_9BACT|nr:DUF1737 domain-containing protein [Pontibacter chinhatensis]SFH04737.1 protein of unknown function [Pontibacter chinhatensis]
MEYNIITAPDLEGLASEVAGFLPQGWRLKGGILEHGDGYAQQLVRHTKDRLRVQQQQQRRQPAKQRRTKWIE